MKATVDHPQPDWTIQIAMGPTRPTITILDQELRLWLRVSVPLSALGPKALKKIASARGRSWSRKICVVFSVVVSDPSLSATTSCTAGRTPSSGVVPCAPAEPRVCPPDRRGDIQPAADVTKRPSQIYKPRQRRGNSPSSLAGSASQLAHAGQLELFGYQADQGALL